MMKIVLTATLLLTSIGLTTAQTPTSETRVRQTVESFYNGFNSHAFDSAAAYTSDDWNHINPFGGRTRGRLATLQDLKQVHSTFLKGVTDTIESMDVRFATPSVAVVTVISQVSTYITPDGVRHQNERQIRTFVVVKRSGRWLIMQDQNTIVRG